MLDARGVIGLVNRDDDAFDRVTSFGPLALLTPLTARGDDAED